MDHRVQADMVRGAPFRAARGYSTNFQATSTHIAGMQTTGGQTAGFQTANSHVVRMHAPGVQQAAMFQTASSRTARVEIPGGRTARLQTASTHVARMQTIGGHTPRFQVASSHVARVQTPGGRIAQVQATSTHAASGGQSVGVQLTRLETARNHPYPPGVQATRLYVPMYHQSPYTASFPTATLRPNRMQAAKDRTLRAHAARRQAARVGAERIQAARCQILRSHIVPASGSVSRAEGMVVAQVSGGQISSAETDAPRAAGMQGDNEVQNAEDHQASGSNKVLEEDISNSLECESMDESHTGAQIGSQIEPRITEHAPFLQQGNCSIPQCEVVLKFESKKQLFVCRHRMADISQFFLNLFYDGDGNPKIQDGFEINEMNFDDTLLFLMCCGQEFNTLMTIPSDVKSLVSLVHSSCYFKCDFLRKRLVEHLQNQMSCSSAETKMALVQAAYSNHEEGDNCDLLEMCIRLCATLTADDLSVLSLSQKVSPGVLAAIYEIKLKVPNHSTVQQSIQCCISCNSTDIYQTANHDGNQKYGCQNCQYIGTPGSKPLDGFKHFLEARFNKNLIK